MYQSGEAPSADFDPLHGSGINNPADAHRATAELSFADRVLNAGLWTFLFRTFARGIGFVRNIALARILAPEDIGLFGIVLVILSILERFTETGFRSALVQKKDTIDGYFDSVWTTLALRRVGLAFIVVIAAPSLASFFGEARATPLLYLLGLSILIQAFGNIAVVQFQRELEVRRQYLHTFSGTVADLVVSVSLAIYLRSAWALMLGLVASRLVSVFVSYVVHPYRPRIRIDWGQTRELTRFGRWVFAKNVITFLAYRGDNFVVGKVLGAPALGVYMLAYSISEVVTVEVARITNNVAFPAYSRSQTNTHRVRAGFLAATELIAAISLPIAVTCAVVAEPLTLALLGDRWIDVARLLPPLAFAGCARAIVSNGGAVSSGLGHSEHGFQLALVQTCVMYAVMYPLMTSYGLVGLSFAVLTGALAPLPLFVRNAKILLGVEPALLARTLLPGLTSSAAAAAVLLVTANWGSIYSVPLLLARLAAAGCAMAAVAVIQWYWLGSGPLQQLALIKRRAAAPCSSRGGDKR